MNTIHKLYFTRAYALQGFFVLYLSCFNPTGWTASMINVSHAQSSQETELDPSSLSIRTTQENDDPKVKVKSTGRPSTKITDKNATKLGKEQPNLEGPHLPLNEAEVRLSFSHGCNAYVYGSYQEAVSKLTRLVRPQVLLNTSDDLETAYKYLGLAHFYLGQQELAQEFLRDLLYLNPQHKFDAAKIPPNAMSFINTLRLELQSKINQRQTALDHQRKLNKRRQLERSRQLIILEQQVNQRLVAFVPFGAGQFQNRDQGLGYFFLASEVIAVGMSAGFFWGVESLRLPNGRFSKDDYAVAQQLQRAQVVSGGIAVGLMVSGVIHAVLNYKKRHDVGNYLDSDLQYEDDIDPEDADDPLFRLD